MSIRGQAFIAGTYESPDRIVTDRSSAQMHAEVVFAGLEGGPSHAAARARFGQTASFVPAATAADALDEVSRRGAEFALVPFETSIDGPVQGTITALIAIVTPDAPGFAPSVKLGDAPVRAFVSAPLEEIVMGATVP